MGKSQWFVECNPVDNEYLSAFLSEHGIGEESKFTGIICSDGKPHDLHEIPSWDVTKMRGAKYLKRTDPIFRFRFWKRDNSNQAPRPADFLEKVPHAKSKKVVNELLTKKKKP